MFSFLRKRPLHLVSPHSIDECAQRLRAAADLKDAVHFTYAPVPGSPVKGTMINHEYILRWERGPWKMAFKLLEMSENDATSVFLTRIEGMLKLPVWSLGPFAIIPLAFLLGWSSHNWFMPLLWIGLGISWINGVRKDAGRLQEFVKQTLDAKDGAPP